MGRRLQKIKNALKRFKDNFRPFAPKCNICGKRIWIFQRISGQNDNGSEIWYHDSCLETKAINELFVRRLNALRSGYDG